MILFGDCRSDTTGILVWSVCQRGKIKLLVMRISSNAPRLGVNGQFSYRRFDLLFYPTWRRAIIHIL